MLGSVLVLSFALLFGMYSPVSAATMHDQGQHTYAAQACQANGPYPDATCTPGAIFSNATAKEVCTPGYASSVRNVSQSTKRKVYASYGISSYRPGQYEVDHFISLGLGGSNAISNLWPEAGSPFPGYREKNVVEYYLYKQVCSGALSLRDAQYKISHDWVAIYNSIK